MLLSEQDVFLDGPTNHLDAESVAWLEHFLEDFPGTVVAITHDRYFLDNAAGWILELDRGRGIPYEGNYSTWLEAKEKRIEQEQRQEASHQKAIKAELDWVRSNPKGRQAKNKARLQRFEELNSQEFQTRNETNEIYIPPGARLGDKVVEVADCGKPLVITVVRGCELHGTQRQHRGHYWCQWHGQVDTVSHPDGPRDPGWR